MSTADFMLLRRMVLETAARLQNEFAELTVNPSADDWSEIATELERCHKIASDEADRLGIAESRAAFEALTKGGAK